MTTSEQHWALWTGRNGQKFWGGPFATAGRAWGRLQQIIDAQPGFVVSGTQMSNAVPSRPVGDFRQSHLAPAVSLPATEEYGPWCTAQFDSDCDGCAGGIVTGSDFRSDGHGGWLCSDCGER
jgi:hypothetical protein